MKTLKAVLVILSLSVVVVAQQTNARVAARCGLSEGSGFENPICGVEAGGTLSNDRIAFDASAFYLLARKKPGGGHNVGGEATLRIGVGDVFFVGPAAGYNRQTTNLYVKDALAVGAEAGLAVDNYVLSARFLQDVTSVNKGRRYTAKLERYGSRHIYIVGRIEAADFRCNQGPAGLTDHCFSVQGTGSIGFHFR